MTAYCWRSNVGSVIMCGCGYTRDPFICKYKHVILCWWDHRRECTQNDTDEECERSPACPLGVWLRVCLTESLFHPGEDTCCERYTLTHVSDTRRPLKVHPRLRRLKTSQIYSSMLNISTVGQTQYLIPNALGRGNLHSVNKKLLSKKSFSHCHDSKMWTFVIEKRRKL